MTKLAHAAGLEMHIGTVFVKDFYCTISFGNVFMGYTLIYLPTYTKVR